MNLEKQYKMNFRKIGCAVIMLTLTLSAAAQSESGKKFEYRIKAGFNIGGTLPIPLPAEIRKIESYSPTFCAGSRRNGRSLPACASKPKA